MELKKPNTLPDIERIFNQYIKEPIITDYRERGCRFTKFKDPLTGKLFILSVKEYIPRKKQQK